MTKPMQAWYIQFRLPDGYLISDMVPYLPHIGKAEFMWEIRRKRKNIRKMAWLLRKETGQPILPDSQKRWMVMDENQTFKNSRYSVFGGSREDSSIVTINHPKAGKRREVPEAPVASGSTPVVEAQDISLVASLGHQIGTKLTHWFALATRDYKSVYHSRRPRKMTTHYVINRMVKETRECRELRMIKID